MTYERQEIMDAAKKRGAERLSADRSRLEMLAQAAVKTAHLTGVPQWDTFLSYIEAAVEATERQLAHWDHVLCSPEVVNADEIMKAKIAAVQCRERIAAWNAVLSLPKEIQESGDKAKDVLSRMESDAED